VKYASKTHHIVMAGLVPAIHVFVAARLQVVDARHKAGHDGTEVCLQDGPRRHGRALMAASTKAGYLNHHPEPRH
jgi:hypothetical protein